MEQQVLVFGEPLKRMPKDLYIPPEALRVLLETFEGPLDLLLYLIRKHNIDILDIPIALITEQYLAYIEAMKAQDMSIVADYLLMAATLAEIKARMMLPVPPSDTDDEQEVDPRADLAAQLLAYAQNAKAAQRLADLARVGEGTVLSGHSLPACAEVRFRPPPADMAALQQAMLRLLRRQQVRQAHTVEEEPFSLEARMVQMEEALLLDDDWYELSHFYQSDEGRGGQVVSLMAILELDKRQFLQWRQTELFAPVWLRARQGAVYE